jgi:DNA polymerase/3'-5' exonuclease PolX
MAYTGSMSYNIKTRASAAKRGTVLNQYGLFNKSDKKPLAYKEKKILKLIGEPYIIPECR